MLKHFALIILSLMILIAILPLVALGEAIPGQINSGYYFYTVENECATIARYVKGDIGELTIPQNIDGYPVVAIGDGAFNGLTNLTSVTIPDSVKSIGDKAFMYCNSLPSIIIPEGVTSIGSESFSDCESLVSAILPDSLTQIDNQAFKNCASLPSISIPKGVINIGDSVFESCFSLTAVEVASDNPVYSSINGILFDKNQKSLLLYPSGKGDKSYQIPQGVETITSNSFGFCKHLTSVSIPDSVIKISDNAIQSCDSLTDVLIPDSVTSIGEDAFASCNITGSVMIPTGVINIGMGAFSGNKNLVSIEVAKGNNAYSSEDGVLFTKDYKQLMIYPAGKPDTSYNIPQEVELISRKSFYMNTSITSITIPEGVTSIGYYAFGFCFNLESLSIPQSVIEIDPSAFMLCDKLSITIPSGSIAEQLLMGMGFTRTIQVP